LEHAGAWTSKGDRVTLRKHINKLRYSPEVMRLISAVSKRKRTREPRRREGRIKQA